MDNLGLSHTVTTYDGLVNTATVYDRKMMPDPAFYYECLRASFEELRAAARDLDATLDRQNREAQVDAELEELKKKLKK